MGPNQGCVSIYDVVQQSIFNWWSQPIAHFSLFFPPLHIPWNFQCWPKWRCQLVWNVAKKSASSFDPAHFECAPPLLRWKKRLLLWLGPRINKLWLAFQMAALSLRVIHKSPIYCQSIKSGSSNKYPFRSASYIWIRLIFADTISRCCSSLFK